jgi:hypothetical protein
LGLKGLVVVVVVVVVVARKYFKNIMYLIQAAINLKISFA